MMKRSFVALLCVGLVVAFVLAGGLNAQNDPAPSTQPAETAAAEISADAKPVLEQMAQAYASLQSLRVAGEMTGEFHVQGEQISRRQEFTGSYLAPGLFRHHVEESVTLGSTGESIYVHSLGDQMYDTADAPDGKQMARDLPPYVEQILGMQNPSLLLAISADPQAELLNGIARVELADPVQIDDKDYTSLRLSRSDGDTLIARIDPDTHLIRRVEHDLRPMVQRAGAVDVRKAEMVVDYTTVESGGELKAEQFAWTAPADAVSLAEMRAQQQQMMAHLRELEGKPAPDFTLTSADGRQVKFADLKGQVVLLDFWATWCAPCVASMPHLQKIDETYGPMGLELYAVNVGEPAERVKQFTEERGLKLKVLLDSNSRVFQSFNGQGLPHQVLIGRDGLVRRVSAGITLDGSSMRALAEAIEATLAEN